MATAETGKGKSTFSMEAGWWTNHSVSGSGIDVNNVCQLEVGFVSLIADIDIIQKKYMHLSSSFSLKKSWYYE